MSKLTINFTNEKKFTRDLDANCKWYGYQTTLPDGTPNPQTKQDFIEGIIKKTFQDTSRDRRRMDAITNLIIEE